MKFTILPIATALLTSSCTAANTIEDNALAVIRNNLHTLVATKMDYNFLSHPGHGGDDGHEHDHSPTDISPECESEIEALGENKDLVAAANTLGQSCPVSMEGNNLKQDFGSCDAGQLQLSCTAAGGKFTTVKSVDMTCSVMGQKININLSDMPDCIGKSCEDSVLNIAEGKKEMATLFEAVLLSQGMMATCTPSGGSSSSGTPAVQPPSPTPNFPPSPSKKTFNSASSIFMNKTILVGGFLVLLLANMLV